MNENEFEDLKKKKKEEKKKGFLGWLREKLGFSPKGMGNLSEGARDINLAGIRGAGTRGIFGRGDGLFGRGGLFGASGRGTGGLFSFLGGNGAIVTLALVGLAVGMTLYYRSLNNSSDTAGYSSMGQVPISSYVPRILKEQSDASSLDMFKEANKGAISLDEEELNKNKKEENANDENNNSIDKQANLKSLTANLGFENKPRLQTDMKFGLTSDIGSGSNKFSALGGFGNHMGKFGPQVGSGFSKNDFDKNSLLKTANAGKLSPIKSQKRPVIAQGYKFQNVKGGKRAFDQAKAIKTMQLAPNYSRADIARSNLDKAWEGGTGGAGDVGVPSGGSGIGDGGSGVVQTPSSLDNIGDTTEGINPNTDVPNVPGYKFDTPWAGLIQKAMMFLMISALLAGIASMVAKIKPWGLIVAIGLALAAVALGVMVIMIGMQLMKQFGQNKLGMIYIIGGGIAIASAIAAIAGVWISWAAMLAKILAAAAGIIGMFASMAAGPAMQKAAEKELNNVNKQTAYIITSSYRKYIG
jgi:hypothetical protein